MRITGKIVLTVNGNPIGPASGTNVKALIESRIRIMAPDIEYVGRRFSDLKEIMIWTGTPKHVGDAQKLLAFLRNSLGTYLREWDYSISLHMIETRGS